MRPKRIKKEKRMCEAISLRVLPEMRAFLEATAEKHNVGLCEAARIALQVAMDQARTESEEEI